MSLKRVVLIAALVALASPAAALADGITFGFTGGNMSVTRPFITGSAGSSSGSVVLHYLTKSIGSVPFGTPATPTYGTPPVILPPFVSPAANNFGTLSFTTGSVIGATSTSATFGAGGSVLITSGGTLGTDTSGAITNGTPLFIGYFSGPTTMTPMNFCTGTCDPTTFNFKFILSGPVAGNLDSSVLSHFGLGSNPSSNNGLLMTFVVGFTGLTDPTGQLEGGAVGVVVPEPGTLALFGTGLIGVAGFIRRRIKS